MYQSLINKFNTGRHTKLLAMALILNELIHYLTIRDIHNISVRICGTLFEHLDYLMAKHNFNGSYGIG